MTHPEPEARGSATLTQHRAFPAVVALWFAALLGLGSLVLPAPLLERLAEASGLATLVPAASPPLGLTARLLVAVFAGIGGAALGLVLARRVTRASGARPAPRRLRAASVRSPLNVLDELDDERVTNGHAPPLSRRRAAMMAEGQPDLASATTPAPPPAETELLILSDPTVPSGSPPEAAPETTPAQSTDEDLAMTAEAAPFPRSIETPTPHSSTGGDWSRQVFTGSADAEVDSQGVFDGGDALANQAINHEDPTEQGGQPRDGAPERGPLRPVADDTADEPGRASWEEQPLADLGLVQLVQRLGSSLERRRAAVAEAQARAQALAQAQAQAQAAAATFAPVEPAEPVPAAAHDPGEALPPLVALPETGVEAARAEEAALARAAWFGTAKASDEATQGLPAPALDPAPDPVSIPSPQPTIDASEGTLRPAFLSSLAAADLADEDEDDEPFPDFNLPLRAAEGRQQAADDGGNRYRSLLAVGSPASDRKFVRLPLDESQARPSRLFDAPGSRPFGKQPAPAPQPAGDAPAPAAETDAALRAALATLQRMSGSA